MKNSKNNFLYTQIKESILKDLGALEAHQKIPSRVKLMKQYNVTRTTIDRSISELIGEGYLYTIDGSGTYKAESKESKREVFFEREGLSWAAILPNIMHDTYPGILRGIEDVANEHTINVVICNTDNKIEKQSDYIYQLIKSQISGIIIVPAITGKNDLTPFYQLEENRIPFVFCNRSIVGIEAPQVISNNFYGGFLATKHLIQQGYSRIAYLSRPLYPASSERYQGYMSALAESSMPIKEEHVIFEEDFEAPRSGYESAKRMLSLPEPPDAIFCFNDTLAKGAYEGIEESGLHVGVDVGLVGYDDTHICYQLPVQLTSVKFKTYETGLEAAKLLFHRLTDTKASKNKTVFLQPELVVRDSCNPNRT